MDDALGDLIATLGSVDHEAIDWANVLRTTVLIHQHFRYEYPGPIHELRQRLMVVPPDFHDGQRLVTHKIRVSGCNVDTERSLRHVRQRDPRLLAWSTSSGASTSPPGSWSSARRAPTAATSRIRCRPTRAWAQPSRLTEPDDALRGRRRRAARDRRSRASSSPSAISARVHDHFTLRATARRRSPARPRRPGPAAVGVCQDYAHCMLALCRLCGLPARYVSGPPARRGRHARLGRGAASPHPTEEDALRAVAFDPTHDRRAGLKYLSVAVGRDYADVPPTSGTFEAPYAGRADDAQARRGHAGRVPAAAPAPPRSRTRAVTRRG